MLETGLSDFDSAPGSPSVLFCDEAQDMNPLMLSLIRKWGSHDSVSHFVLAGDDDQCQPAGETVLTQDGYKRIEELDPEKDRLISYSKGDKQLFGFRQGYAFNKTVRNYHGGIFTVSAGGKNAKATDNHLWLSKWTEKAKKDGYCVYLMRRGRDFRIGWCKLFRTDGCLHLGRRSTLEKADATWILYTSNNKTDVSIYESYFSTVYGITTAPFRGLNNTVHYTAEHLKRLYDMLYKVDIKSRVLSLLEDRGLSYSYPIWTPNSAISQRGGKTIMKIRSINIIPEFMSIPVMTGGTGKSVEWRPVTDVSSSHGAEDVTVYSLEVEKYHTYVTNGLVTHNCLYRFLGSSPDAFLNPPIPEENEKVLPQSYRVPRAVQEYSQKIIQNVRKRKEKLYNPRDVEGSVEILSEEDNFKNPGKLIRDAEKHLANNESVMFLATCSYMLEDLKKYLRESGIPFHNPYRRINKAWNPLNPSRGVSSADKLLAFLRPEEDVWGDLCSAWTVEDCQRWVPLINSRSSGLKNGIKKGLLQLLGGANSTVTLSDLFKDDSRDLVETFVFGELRERLEWFDRNLVSSMRSNMDFPLAIARNQGPRKLREEPQVLLGTIHSVKGGEADVVYLFPDLSSAGLAQWQSSDGEDSDSVYRLFYVGATRAKSTLKICRPAQGSAHFKLPGVSK